MTDDEDRWFELMLSLYEHRSSLTRTFLHEVTRIDSFKNTEISNADLNEMANKAYDAILRYIINEPKGVDLRVAVARELGKKRAQQRIPLEDLQTAISLDFKIIWDELSKLADKNDASLVTSNCVNLWEAVNGFILATQAEYHAESLRMESDNFAEKSLLLRQFVNNPDLASQNAKMAARELKVPLESEYIVCFGETAAGFPNLLRTIHSYSKRVNIYQENADEWYMFWPEDVPYGTGHPLQVLMNTGVVYMTNIAGLAGIPRAFHTVKRFTLAVGIEHYAHPVNMNEYWFEYAKTQLFDSLPEFNSHYSNLINTLDPENKQSILLTVEKYLETGSISMTGEALLCNRNTVTKRIKQFEDSTHLNLRNPRDLALSVLLIPHIQSSGKQPMKH